MHHVIRKQSINFPNKACFFNIEREISNSSIWNSQECPKLWLYNLHYFDDLNAANSFRQVDQYETLILRWIAENRVGKGIGWEPYPTSLRIVNWIKWCLSGNQLNERIRQSLVLQARWLSRMFEFHILGNHLFANIKAILFVGIYFSGKEADSWYLRGLKLLEGQLEQQILSDGGHFELSPMYHDILIEDLLDIVQLHKLFDRSVPKYIDEVIPRMLTWSKLMTHPDGDLPFFNDSALGVAGTFGDLAEYAQRLGYDLSSVHGKLTYLPESGYVRMVSDEAVVLADIAQVGPDYQPGHAHADTLSFEFSLSGERVIVNGGTSTYDVNEERQRQRGTSAHSTVTIDSQNSSEVWAGFRVARRARVIGGGVKDSEGLWAFGEHDGYSRLSDSLRHRREWNLLTRVLNVYDCISGCGNHFIEIYFHLTPKFIPRISKNKIVEILCEESRKLHCSFRSSEPEFLYLQKTTWHPFFGCGIPSWSIVIRLNHDLPFSHHAQFDWRNLH